MGKKKRTMKKVQTGGASHKSEDVAPSKEMTQTNKDDKAISMAIRKFLAEYWHWLKKHKYDVISGFVVAVAAVYIAFWLAGRGEQRTLDKVSKQMINLVLVETEHNAIIIENILNDYAVAGDARINIGRLDSTATVAAFQNTNLLSFLSFERVAFLRTYINTVTILNQSMQTYHEVLKNEGYRTNSKVEKLRQLVHNNAADVFAVNKLVQEELSAYFEQSVSGEENMKNTKDRLKFYKERALKGEFSVSYE